MTSEPLPRADARRNRRTVMDAAVRLLSERPSATMQEVADASGLGRTTVYRHFPRRQDLVDALYLEVLREAGKAIHDVLSLHAPAVEVLHSLGPRFVAIGDRYRFLDVHPELRERALTRQEEVGRPLERFLIDAQERGELRGDVPVSWMLACFRTLSVAAMTEVAVGRLEAGQAGELLGTTIATAFRPSGK